MLFYFVVFMLVVPHRMSLPKNKIVLIHLLNAKVRAILTPYRRALLVVIHPNLHALCAKYGLVFPSTAFSAHVPWCQSRHAACYTHVQFVIRALVICWYLVARTSGVLWNVGWWSVENESAFVQPRITDPKSMKGKFSG